MPSAEVAELADAQASEACGGNLVGVQIPPSAPASPRNLPRRLLLNVNRVGHIIGVIGESEFSDPANERRAEDIGRLIGAGGHTLICGGLSGVMEAACRGAKSAGGTTIGILPGADRAQANRFVDYAIATGMGQSRNALIVLSADALVAIGGGYGTLSEIGHALRAAKPVVGIGTWEVGRGGTRVPMMTADSAQDAWTLLIAALRP